MDFLASSLVVQKEMGMKVRSKNGIFFTPKPLRDIIFKKIKTLTPKTILEPTCGSGEFLVDCENIFKNATCVGVELQEKLVNISRNNVKNASIEQGDFLKWNGGKFDLIIGNPPFVQIKSVIKEAAVGRSNLYIEILYKCLTQHLSPGGVLAMVLPSTIMNGCFAKPTRDLVLTKKILYFETIRNHTFKDTSAGVSILILKNEPGDSKYNFGGILTNHTKELRNVTKGRRKLRVLNVRLQYGVMTGSLKEYFSRDRADIPFILPTELVQDNVVFNEDKRLFIKKDVKAHSGRCLLLSRSSGVVMGSEYTLKYSLFESPRFMFDSCMIGIFGKDIDVLHKSLADDRTSFYLKTICGSGRLTKDIILDMPIFE